MTVTVVSTVSETIRRAVRMRPGDVLVFNAWRVVIAEDQAEPHFWLEGPGCVHYITRRPGGKSKLESMLINCKAEQRNP